ncbi:HWE histidine kinase domain-containing protein [Aquidulcibacter paucihalophilus]|uniref:HWE histidine kinase domain-containing protein n=1 Tax=Aquidulcibacter paucihalophilus TaxID=1978549 RepID=UPI000A190476|nr:HWE histidine kinase domain-containing protein [Aquidulcibacter paucihalophilus]
MAMPQTLASPTLPPDPPTLTNCDKERIHEINSIQSGGFLIALTPDWIIERASANCGEFLNQPLEEILGANLTALIMSEAVHAIRNRLSSLYRQDVIERLFAIVLQEGGPGFDLAVHASGDLILLEAELSEKSGELNAGSMVRSMIDHVQHQHHVPDLTHEAVRLVQALTGYDRVMVYQFHPDGSGEVIAERCRPSMEPYLGLRYPATDIPKQARALLIRNPIRNLLDIDSPPSLIVSTKTFADALTDLSMSSLRSHSPIHLEYLRNMGVAATMTISLLKNGALWGLIACHHMTARTIGYERRTTAEVFGQILALLIDQCEREELITFETSTRQITTDLLASVALAGVATKDVAQLANQLVSIVPCDGTAFCIDGSVTLKGSTPSLEEFEVLRSFLDGVSASRVYSSNEIESVCPSANSFKDRAAGMLAIPISTIPRDYLVFFRKETASTVKWAGDPTKSVEVLGSGEVRISPRKSFKAWQETLHGKSTQWTDAELRAAEALQITVLEVVLRLISATEAERNAASQTQDLLIAELNHRVRNILGLIRGLISQTRINAKDMDTFASVLGDRVHALARAHDQITAKNWGPGSFQSLITTEVEAYLGPVCNTIHMSGPPVLLIPKAFSTLALVIHELITNAAKYGAFCGEGGHVDISWRIGPQGDLIVNWAEIGGPPVTAPSHRGFGSTIIEASIPHELGGESAITFLATGVKVNFSVPAQFIVLEEQPITSTTTTADTPLVGSLQGHVLLVEDNLIIALDAEAMLLSLGAERVLVASNVKDALAILDREKPSFALLDVNLGNQNSFPIADRLFEIEVPFIFATGYGSGINYPSDQNARPFITKPYTKDSIAKALGGIEPFTKR